MQKIFFLCKLIVTYLSLFTQREFLWSQISTLILLRAKE